MSMLGAPCTMPLNPFTKNFLLMSMTMNARTICTMPMPTGLPSKKAGSGQPNMEWPMEKYISTARKPSDQIRRRFRTGVSWSFSASSSSASLAEADCFCSAPFRDAP